MGLGNTAAAPHRGVREIWRVGEGVDFISTVIFYTAQSYEDEPL